MRKGKHIVRTLWIAALLCLIASGALAQGKLTLPSALKAVEDEAFYGSTAIDVVELPEGIERIGSRAFADSSIRKINLPVSLTSIAEDAFEGCGALEVTAEPGSYAYSWAVGGGQIIGYVIENGKVTITNYTRTDTQVIIPSEIEGYPVVGIGASAFNGYGRLTSITLPAGVTSIGDWAFTYCTRLANISLPDSLTSIGNSAFSYCRGLTSVTLPASVTSIGSNAFFGCSSALTIHGISGSYAETYAAENGIHFAPSDLDYVIENGEATITGYTGTDAEVIVPAKIEGYPVVRIGDDVFRNCSVLRSITLPDGLTSIGDSAFYYCSRLTSITLPDSLTSIGRSALSVCSSLTSITLPDGLTSIGMTAFSGCSSLTSITLPASVTSIGDAAFSSCSNLTSITLPGGLTSIPAGLFSSCTSLVNITLPASVTSIGDWAFTYCTKLANITLPASVTSIGSGAFSDCSSALTIHGVTGSYAETYALENGIPFVAELIAPSDFDYVIENGEVTITGYTGAGTEVVVPTRIEGYPVVRIGDEAFRECSGLVSIALPDSVTSIGKYAFDGCGDLTSVTLPDGLTSIGTGTFNNCIRLANITLPASVISIGKGTFFRCSSLTTITIPAGVASLGDFTFYDCSSLTSITLPSSVTSIGNNAFSDCSSALTICGISGSYAETYAAENGIPFVAGAPERTSAALFDTVTDAAGSPFPV